MPENQNNFFEFLQQKFDDWKVYALFHGLFCFWIQVLFAGQLVKEDWAVGAHRKGNYKVDGVENSLADSEDQNAVCLEGS